MKTLNIPMIMSAQDINPVEFTDYIHRTVNRLNHEEVDDAMNQLMCAINEDPQGYANREHPWYEEYALDESVHCEEHHWFPCGIRKMTAKHFSIEATPLFHSIFNYYVDDSGIDWSKR